MNCSSCQPALGFSAWNLTLAFPGAGYYSGVSSTPGASFYIGTLFGTAGTATVESHSNCSVNGQQGCVASGSYVAGTSCVGNDSNCFVDEFTPVGPNQLKAINYWSIATNASNIRSGVTISDVTGTLGDCSTNAATGCVTTATYKSADLTNLSAGNIKSGVTIAGTAGQYPSSSFKLTGSSGSDLTTPTFNAQIKSSATFQYFGSDGVRYTGTGDTDITAANIASGLDIFGTTGSLTGAVAPDPWNVRVGVTVNGVTGKLKVNCRNRVNSAIFNYDGPIGSIGHAGVTDGTAFDIWDTIDDWNYGAAGLPGDIVTAWGSNTDCGGVGTAADDNVWTDVTTTAGGAASSCTADASRCTMKDKITGLWWSPIQDYTAWDVALRTCDSLDFNGYSDWRLPTQKELMEAYTHGIRSAARPNWMTEGDMHNSHFWSGSSVSLPPNGAWYVHLNGGYTYGSHFKDDSYQVVCVR